MDSDEFNSTMKQIEYDLDALYENIRMLNDVADYCRNYIVNSVEEKRAKFIEQLKIIEQLTDSYQDKSYITQMVPFLTNQEIITNRQGESVKAMSINSGTLEMAGKKVEEAVIQSAVRITSHGSTKSTPENLALNKPSRSTYLMDEPIPGGVEEEYEVRFKSPVNANYIDINVSNCEVTDLCAINDTDENIPVDIIGAFIAAKDIQGIRFKLNSKEYVNSINPNAYSNTKTLLPAVNGYRSNKQDFVKDEDHLSDAEKLNRMNLYRGNYAIWAEEAAAVERKNALSAEQTVMNYSTANGGREFDGSTITLPDGSLLEEFASTGYQYTPSGEVKAEELIVNGNYEASPAPTFSEVASGVAKHGYAYSFGIDSMAVQKRSIYDECGFVSALIDIGPCSYIEIAVIEAGENPVEYYIADGTKVVPALPIGVKKINGELLHYGLDTRFAIDKSKDITIYKDGKETDSAIEDKDLFDFSAHTYTISYTTTSSSKYFPDNEKIQIKVLQRASSLPTTIQAISINKHGGEAEWTILD